MARAEHQPAVAWASALWVRLAVMAGGVAGASLRWLLVDGPPAVLGHTAMLVLTNVAGAAVLGAVTARARRRRWRPARRVAAAAGFCGGLTSLSGLALDAGTALRQGRWLELAALDGLVVLAAAAAFALAHRHGSRSGPQ